MSLLVSVSGVRGLVGETLTPTLVLEFAHCLGAVLGPGKRVVLARDTRPSGQVYAAAAEAGLLATGCAVTRLGVAMTPTVGFAIRQGRFDAGIIITASHNPAPWNGIKFLDQRGLAPDPETAARLAQMREQRAWTLAKSGFVPPASDEAAGSRHAEAVMAAVEQDLSSVRGVRVVLDSINGAGCVVSGDFLRRLGCELVHLNSDPSGAFAHAPEPVAENLGELCAAVTGARAAVGFAQDPDADRLALVDEHGRYIGEEYTLALAAWATLLRRPGPVAANLSTSRLIDAVARRFGVAVHRTPVGEANVARAMMRAGCVVGGEGNGGVIDPRFSLVRDSLAAMSLVLQLMAATGKSLSMLVAELPAYVMIKQKAECSRERIAAAVAAATTAFRELRPDCSDGVRVDFPEGWVHLRASNTEPIVRLIAEAESRGAAEQLVARVRDAAGL